MDGRQGVAKGDGVRGGGNGGGGVGGGQVAEGGVGQVDVPQGGAPGVALVLADGVVEDAVVGGVNGEVQGAQGVAGIGEGAEAVFVGTGGGELLALEGEALVVAEGVVDVQVVDGVHVHGECHGAVGSGAGIQPKGVAQGRGAVVGEGLAMPFERQLVGANGGVEIRQAVPVDVEGV